MTNDKLKIRSHLALLAGYSLLTLLLTWPTASHFTHFVPGDGIDDPAIIWNLWWVKYSLLNEPQNPFFSHHIFYPVGVNLAFYTLTILNGLSAMPLLLNFGVVTAGNLQLWFNFVVGAYGAALLTYHLLRTHKPVCVELPLARLGAALAGLIFAFASSNLFYVALGQFNIASSHWIPYTILFFLEMRADPANLRWPALTALFLVLQAWTELTHASFLLVFMSLYWLYWLISDPTHRVVRPPYLRSAGLLAGLFALGISPFLAAMLPTMRAEGDFLVVGGGFADIFSSDLLGFFIPTMHHPWLGTLVGQTGIDNFDKGQQVYLGYSLLVLAGLGAYTRRREAAARFWPLAGLAFWLLMLGPQITINGWGTGLPGPFILLQTLPFFKGNRYPSRYSVMLFLSLAPLAAWGFIALAKRLRNLPPTLLAGALAAFFLFEHLAIPLPQSDMTIPAPYRQIAQDETSSAVLDIPLGWRNGFRVTGAQTVGIMFGQFYQTAHQHPILHGNTSRNAELQFQYFSNAPVINSLIQLQNNRPLPVEAWQEDVAYTKDVLRFLGIKYIVVRPETPSFQSNPQATLPYIETLFPVESLVNSDTLYLFRVDLPPLPSRTDLLPDSPLLHLYFGEGWGLRQRPIAAQRRDARLLLPLDGHAQTIHFEVRLPNTAAPTGSTMSLSLNGWRSEPVNLSRDWQTISLDLPAAAVQPGLNQLWLHFETVYPVDPTLLDVTIISAGEEAGNLGHIYLNGDDLSPNGRGYNVALIDPATAKPLAVASFDTHLDPQAGQAMADFIAAAPQTALVAVAAADEASQNLSQAGVAALQSIGGQVDLRDQFRAGHALIGSKTDGLILEATSPRYRPAQLSTALGLTEPQLAAIFAEIVVESRGE